ncbi:unnamed protein product [Symbiodinium sp. CCMP2592]|nr:unnamed protein product [Symbiodinium sp. CCMP2592]
MAVMDAAKRVTTRLPPEDKLHSCFLQASFASLLPSFIPADALRWIFLSRAGKRILDEGDIWRHIFQTGLDLTGACIGPEGAAALAQRMPENLQTLSLDAAWLF